MDVAESRVKDDESVTSGAKEDGELSNNEEIAKLKKTIEELNEEFGVKRAKYKDLFMQKEEELRMERETKEKIERDMICMKDELNEAKSQVALSDFKIEHEVDSERQRRHQELQHLTKQYEVALKEEQEKHEAELNHYKVLNEKLKMELNDVRSNLGYSSGNIDAFPTSLTAISKTLARKLNSTVSLSTENLQDVDDKDKDGSKKSSVKYVQEDAGVLRSLVVQLEEEVAALKDKVRADDEQIAALQSAQSSIVKGNYALSALLEDGTSVTLHDLNDKLKEAFSGLEAEKSSRADLEMYVNLVNTHKTFLNEELDKVKNQLKDTRRAFEQERKEHEELKQTWAKANEQFVQSQSACQTTIHNLKSLMSPELLRKAEAMDNQVPVIKVDYLSHVNKEKTANERCVNCTKQDNTIERLRSDLHKAASLRSELEEEWSQLLSSFQSKHASLELQLGTYEVILQEVNASCQQRIHDMNNEIKNLSFERELIERKIKTLETEKENLEGKHIAHSSQLQEEKISLPSDVTELHELVLKLKEDLISVKVGKEHIEGEYNFHKSQVEMIEDQKRTIEDSLNAEIACIREELLGVKSKGEKYDELKKRYEKVAMELNTKVPFLEKKVDELTAEKAKLEHELSEAQNRISGLRKDLTSSEELQRDLISLSKSLQIKLESIRQEGTEVRWQHPDDIIQCVECKRNFSEGKEKHNCKHCGKIFCEDCLKQCVRRGNRVYNVCNFCHTLLNHQSAPYFSTEAPHSPE